MSVHNRSTWGAKHRVLQTNSVQIRSPVSACFDSYQNISKYTLIYVLYMLIWSKLPEDDLKKFETCCSIGVLYVEVYNIIVVYFLVISFKSY